MNQLQIGTVLIETKRRVFLALTGVLKARCKQKKTAQPPNLRKGCSTKEECDKGCDTTEDMGYTIKKCDVSCCDKDLCNGAKVPMASGFLFLAWAFAVFVR